MGSRGPVVVAFARRIWWTAVRALRVADGRVRLGPELFAAFGSVACVVAAATVSAGILTGGCGPRSTSRPAAHSGGAGTGVSIDDPTADSAPGSKHEGPITGHEVRMTLYYLATQHCPDAPQVSVPRCGGGSIARVSQSFLKSAAMQGSAKLCDGRVIGVHKIKPLCFAVVPETFPWGVTASGRPATPFRSIAIDPKVFKMGQWYYVAELAGMPLPPPAEGKFHDGCVRSDDTGGGVRGNQIDFFVGHRGAIDGLKAHLAAQKVHLADGTERCANAGEL